MKIYSCKKVLLLLMLTIANLSVKAQAPVAAFDVSDTLVCIGNNVSFTDMSTGGVGGIVSWSWTFGDGGTSTSQNPTYAFSTGAIRTVTLVVTDGVGNTSSISHTVYVLEAQAAPATVRVCSPATTATVTAVASTYPGVIGYWFTASSALISDPSNDTTLVTNLVSGSYIFFWVVTDGGCSDADQVIVYVDNPVVSNAGPDQQLCTPTSSATMAGSNPAPGTGLWTTTSGATITTPSNRNTTVTGMNTAGTYTFVWSVTNGACVSRDTMSIVVTNATTANAGSDQQVCNNPGTATLSGNNPSPGTSLWTTTGSATITSPASSTTGVTGLTTAGTYTFIYTITSGSCVSRDTVLITVSANVAANAGSNLQVCTTSPTATLNGNNPSPGTGLWTTTSTATITSPTSASTGVTGLTTVGNNIFVWTITNGSCVSRDTMVIIVRNPITSNAGADQSYCNATTANLNGNAATPGSGTWTTTGSATITTPSSATSSVSNLSAGNNYFIWTITYGACVTRDTVNIYIDQLITANAGADQQLCETSTSTSLAGNSPSPGTGTWTTTSGATITSPNSPTSTVTGLSVGSYTFVWTIINGLCTSVDSVTVTVSSLITADAGSDHQICSDIGTATLAGNNPSPGSGAWITTSSATITDPVDPNTTVTGLTTAGTYEFIWMVSNGTCLSMDTMLITVDEYVVADAGADQTLCETTTTILLNATAPSQGFGVWISLGTASADNPLDPNSTVSGAVAGANTFVWMVSNGMCLSTDTVDIILTTNIVANAGADQQICTSSGSITLSGSSPSPGTGLWTTNSTGTITSPANPNSNVTGLTTAGTFNFIWTVTNGACVSSDTMAVTVNNSVTANAGSDQLICETTTSALLIGNNPLPASGLWSTTGAATIASPASVSTSVSNLVVGPNTFIWTVTNGTCVSRDTVIVTVSANIVANAGTDQQVCADPGSSTLAANTASPGSGVWFTTSIATINDFLDPNTAVSDMLVAGNYEFIWTISNGACTSSDTIDIVVDEFVQADAGADQSLCETATTVQLSAVAPSQGFGVWISLGVASADNPLDPNSTVSGAVAGINSFVWMVSNGTCLSMDTVDIIISTNEIAIAGSDQQICASPGTATLNGNVPVSGTSSWTTASTATITNPASASTGVTGLTTAGSYDFIYTISNGACVSSDTVTIVVDQYIVADAGIDHSVCASMTSVDTLYGNNPLPGTSAWTTSSAATISNPSSNVTAVSNLVSGSYQFIYTITNSSCVSSDTIIITADTMVTANAGSDQQICASPGFTNLAANNASPGSGAWITTSSATIIDPVDPNTMVTDLASAGAYEFVWMISNGACLSMDTVVVNVDDSVIADAGVDQSLCETATSTNLAAAIPAIGTGVWITTSSAMLNDPLDPNTLVTGLTAGTHEFVWMVSNGMCLVMDTMYIEVWPVATVANAGTDQVVCSNVPSVQLQGNSPIVGSGVWSTTSAASITVPTDSNSTATGIVAGNNEFIWTITNGACSSTDTVVIFANQAPVADAGADIYTVSGNPQAIGGAIVGSSGTPPYTYAWTPATYLNDSSLANPVATAMLTITYTVTVTDSLGCFAQDSMTIYINNPPDANTDSIVIDEDSTVVISILTNDTDLDNNIDTSSVTILAGPYNGTLVTDTVTGLVTYTPNTNYNGIDSALYVVCDMGVPVYCDTAIVYITINPVNDAPVALDDYYTTIEDSCISFNVLLNDTDVENNIDTASFSILVLPTHGMITTGSQAGDLVYCPDSAYYGPDTLMYIICDTGSPVLCDTAYAIITVQPINNAPFAVNDSLRICSSDSVLINILANDVDIENDSIIVSGISIAPANGSASLNANGEIGYMPLSGYNGPDSIQYVVCDDGIPSQCDSAWVIINVTAIPVLSATHINPLCANDSTGSIDLAASGYAPFIYMWSNGEGNEDIDSIPAGIYSVLVLDSLGCSNMLTDTVTAPTALTANVLTQHVNCFGDSSAYIDVTITGGVTPILYNWNNGSAEEDIDSLGTGVYILTVTDSNGCILTITDSIFQPSAALSASSIKTDVVCGGDSTGLIDVTVSGGTPGYSYLWSNASTNEDAQQLQQGIYTVMITDTNGCQFSLTDTLIELTTPIQLTAILDHASCLQGDYGSIDISTAGGTSPYAFSWSNSDVTSYIDSLVAGVFVVIVTDSMNCRATASYTIDDSSSVTANALGDTIICQGEMVDLSTISYTGATYQWYSAMDTLATASTQSVSATGDYYVVVVTTCGTYTSNSIHVEVNPLPLGSVNGPLTTSCDTAVALQAFGGVTYQWTPSSTLDDPASPQPLASPQQTTLYMVTITDANGCAVNDSVSVTVVCDSLNVPSGFSPNGDGLNDVFVISKLEKYQYNRLRIFNRWGNMIYEKEMYDNSWKGVSNISFVKLGQELPDGTYFYVLELGEQHDPMTGYVVIKK